MSSEKIEEYLEVLYKLTEASVPAKTTVIAKHLKIAPASVSEMLQKLSHEGYIEYSPYHGATLTKDGFRYARRIVRKHRLLECFLFNILKVRKSKVHEQACKMEHALLDDAENALCRLLKYPDVCPDDRKSIPVCDLPVSSCVECVKKGAVVLKCVKLRRTDLTPITSLKNGQKGKIVFIRGDKPVVQRLTDMGLTPGTMIEVIKSAPFQGPVKIMVRSSKVAVSRSIALKIFVSTA
jgi:DtxR family Mn-dependent transcriptional regulator